MIINNAVYDGWGNVIGFRCLECDKVVPSMFGNHCNQCVARNEKHEQLIKQLKALESKK